MATVTSATMTAPMPSLRESQQAPDSVVSEEKLKELGKEPVKIRQAKPKWYKLSRKIKASERMLLLDNLATMLAAGLGITDALAILSEEMKNKFMRKILVSVRNGIELGRTFSDGLAMYPYVFPELMTATIRVGELSGTLSDVLSRLAEMARRENQLRRKIIGALMYPSVVMFAMIVVGVIMLTYVFPQIISIFIESNIKLPIQIRIINTIGDIIRDYGFYMLGGIIVLAFGGFFLIKVRKVHKTIDRFVIKLPLLGKQIIKGSIIARVSLNLRTMLMSGLPIVEAMKTIASTIKNLEYRDQLIAVAGEVEVGRSIHDALASRPHLFSPIVIRMIKVGEGTGKLDDILHKLGTYYEEKVDELLGNISTIIEPALLLIVGVLVGFIAVSIISPIYELANNI